MSANPHLAADFVAGSHEYGPVPLPLTSTAAVGSSALPESPRARYGLTESGVTAREALSRVSNNFRQIMSAPRELWIIYLLKFFASYSYFTLSLTLTLFLSKEFGLSDVDAGWSFGVYGLVATISGIVCGWIIDYLGVRLSLLVGAVFGAASRFIIAFTTSRVLALTLLFTVLPFSESLGIPIMTIGIKRYTNDSNCTFGYSLFYSIMNVAALMAGPIVDFFRNIFSDGYSLYIPGYGLVYLSALRMVVITSAISSACLLIISAMSMREVELDEHGNISPFTPNRASPSANLRAVLRDRSFWRLLALTIILVGTRLVFTHLSATLPKYLLRQFGENAPFGLMFAINPFLIIFLVPVVGLMTKHIASFPMILYGSIVASVSPLLICIQQSYLTIILFMVVLSIGEAVYSPRVYEYSMYLSVDGSEGLYTSLSAAPLFCAQLVTGGMSGWLLSSFMPKNGPHYGKVVWGFIGATSMTSPILLWLLRDFIGTQPTHANDKADMEEQTPLSRRSD